MSKAILNITELIIILIIGSVSILTEPPPPLLAIPFMIIMMFRTIFITLENRNIKEAKK